jgi:hypothetical protein
MLSNNINHTTIGGNLKTIKTKLKKVFNNHLEKKLKYNSSDIDSILKYIKKKLKNDKLDINEPKLNKKDFKEILDILFEKMSKKQINKLLININKLIENKYNRGGVGENESSSSVSNDFAKIAKHMLKYYIQIGLIISNDRNVIEKINEIKKKTE